jgi:FKBP-type peptidyl-prolyl cis-trans isomerase (trigger factor)
LSDDLNIEVSEQDLNREMTSFAQMMGSDLKKLKKEWAESGALLRLHARMRREITLDQVIDQVKVNEEMVDRSELEVNN